MILDGVFLISHRTEQTRQLLFRNTFAPTKLNQVGDLMKLNSLVLWPETEWYFGLILILKKANVEIQTSLYLFWHLINLCALSFGFHSLPFYNTISWTRVLVVSWRNFSFFLHSAPGCPLAGCRRRSKDKDWVFLVAACLRRGRETWGGILHPFACILSSCPETFAIDTKQLSYLLLFCIIGKLVNWQMDRK